VTHREVRSAEMIDLYSRVVDWAMSTTMDTPLVLEAL
jgi:transposase InsO family protein